jgi:hypothetical protein
MKKPRARFCWACGRQLWGRHHIERIIDGHHRILHKSCSQRLLEGKEVYDESARDIHLEQSIVQGD